LGKCHSRILAMHKPDIKHPTHLKRICKPGTYMILILCTQQARAERWSHFGSNSERRSSLRKYCLLAYHPRCERHLRIFPQHLFLEKMYVSRIRGGRTLVQSGHPAAKGRYVEGVYGGTIRTVCWLSRN
jgi:hypothetical protein